MQGGWIPVLRQRGRSRHQEAGNGGSRSGLFTSFVDNLPEAMRAKGLYSIFSNYGVVVDTFIPNKRRKMTRSRFGFVRYTCSVAADMVIQKPMGSGAMIKH